MEKASSGKNRNYHPLPWLNLVATEPFYFFHFFIFFSYFAARSSVSQSLSVEHSNHLLRREIQALLTFSVITTIKIVREETWEAFIADSLLYAKGFLFGIASIIDYHLALCYLLGFIVIFCLTQQPPHDGLGDVSHLTPLQLESLLTEGSPTKFWLIEFRALFSSSCVRTSRFLPDLSITYSNKNISFGIVDLGHFPNAAEKFGLSLGELPAYILFDKAMEVARLPDINTGFKTSKHTITKHVLCHHFELDRRLVEYISRN